MLTLPISSLIPAHLIDGGFLTSAADSFRGFAHSSAPVAVTALWQGALVAAGLALCLRLAPRVAAAHRFAAWAAGFGVLIALPFVPALTHLAASWRGSKIGFGMAASLPRTAHPWLQISDRWCLAIAALWMAIALARAVDLAIHSLRLRRLWKSATPVLRTVTFGQDSRLKGFELCTTHELDRPSVIGFFAPRILIPEWLYGRLTPQELEQVVLHEAEHLRRRDDWTNLVQKLCLVAFPLNPALAFIESRMCSEREMACDEGVVRRTQAPRAYAACLAGLAERRIEHRTEALSLGAFSRRPELARRVHSILLRRSVLSPVASRALLGAVGCALAVGAVVLARCPQLVAAAPAQVKAAAEPAAMAADAVPVAPISPLASHFRAINTMAIVPRTTRPRMAVSRSAAAVANSKDSETSLLRSAINAAQTLRSPSPSQVAENTNAAAPVQQELVVFTAYEQVQTSDNELGDKVISDSEPGRQSTGAGANEPGANEPRANEHRPGAYTRNFTITQLVFRVYPSQAIRSNAAKAAQASATPAAAQTPGSAAVPKPGSRTVGSKTPQGILIGLPKAVPLGNGWFVIQL